MADVNSVLKNLTEDNVASKGSVLGKYALGNKKAEEIVSKVKGGKHKHSKHEHEEQDE
jgi:hypothetical protein